MRRAWTVVWGVGIGLLAILSGCGKRAEEKVVGSVAAVRPSPTPTAISAVVSGLQLNLFSDKRQQVLSLKAEGAVGSPGSGDNTIVVQTGTATLFEKGKPTATLRADKMVANREARTVVATGNVRAQSLTEEGRPAIRANTMTWQHDNNLLTGAGNVVITSGTDMTVYAKSFKANTRISTCDMELADTAATGTY